MTNQSDILYVISDPENDELLTLNDPKAPKFSRFYGSFGWMDPAGAFGQTDPCVLIGGLQQDGRYNILAEYHGDLVQVLDAATDFKDALYIKEMWCDNSDVDMMSMVYAHDGLTRYHSLGLDAVGQEIWETPSSKWPHFRDRNTITMIGGVPPTVRTSSASGLNRITSLTRNGKLLVHSRCVKIQWVLGQDKLSEIITNPTLKATTALVWSFTSESEYSDRQNTKPVRRAYTNLRKG